MLPLILKVLGFVGLIVAVIFHLAIGDYAGAFHAAMSLFAVGGVAMSMPRGFVSKSNGWR